MALWQKLQKLDSASQARVSQLYEHRFHRGIRHCLCDVIETQDWDLAAVDEHKANTSFNTLLVCLEEQWTRSVRENTVLQGPNFTGMRDYLLKHFEGQPLALAQILSECLKEEKKILASASEAQDFVSPTMGQKWTQTEGKANELKIKTLEVKKEIKTLEAQKEKLTYIQENLPGQVEKRVALAQSSAAMEEEIQKRANFINQAKEAVLQQIWSILKLAEDIVGTLTDEELPGWKRRQQMACLGSPVNTSLEHLQKCFTAVAEALLGLHQQMQKLQGQNWKCGRTDAPNPSGLVAEIEKLKQSLLFKLLANALVVEEQPVMASLPQRPLILKTPVKFSMAVRFLANLPEFKCLLKVKPVFDKDVDEVKTIKGFRCFDFTRADSKVLDEDTPGGGLVAEFSHMTLKETRAGVNRTSQGRLMVNEQLHIVTFVTEFQYAGLRIDIEASSLPLVVVTASSQVAGACAAVMWFNMLSTREPRDLSLFVDPPPLTWKQLSLALSWQFLSFGQRELDQNQLSALKGKFVDNPDDVVHWSNFSKRGSAWYRIDEILDFIQKYLVDLWRGGLIMGFVSRMRTRELLLERQMGTFLLRFSETSEEVAISFSWVDCANGEMIVHAVEPYTKLDLSCMGLADFIYGYILQGNGNSSRNPLRFLYPDIPRDTAFEPYYNTTPGPKKALDGYIKRNFFVSVDPTPPPSPPQGNDNMEMDMDTDQHAECDELMNNLIQLKEWQDFCTNFVHPSCYQ